MIRHILSLPLFGATFDSCSPPRGRKTGIIYPIWFARIVLLLCHSTSFSPLVRSTQLFIAVLPAPSTPTTLARSSGSDITFPSRRLCFCLFLVSLCFHGGQFVLDIARFLERLRWVPQILTGCVGDGCGLGQQYSTTFFCFYDRRTGWMDLRFFFFFYLTEKKTKLLTAAAAAGGEHRLTWWSLFALGGLSIFGGWLVWSRCVRVLGCFVCVGWQGCHSYCHQAVVI